ncbi:MAG: transglycosylase SLT domain-containing protein [Desulfovibrionaceae bacterium]|nr:transglycosylase SLT domain-containing protein [Desulfovibrionaceae bacterium]MBF0513452.1 transglycosylase SLT domain-containing protein [Desulfovibrionaceae bacterium]
MDRIALLIVVCALLAPGSGWAQQGRAEPGLPRTAGLVVTDAAARAAALAGREAGAAGPVLGRIRLGQGVLGYLAGDYGHAAGQLEEAAGLAAEIAGCAAYYRGLCLYKLGMAVEALGIFQGVAGQTGQTGQTGSARSPIAAAALYMATLCQEKTGVPEQALAGLRDFLERPEPGVLPYALWRAAKIAADLGQFDKVGQYLSRLYLELPGSPLDGQAAALAESLAVGGRLDWRPYSVASLSSRAAVLVRRAQNEKALVEIDRALVEAQGEQAAWLSYLKGKALFALRRTQAAREQFETLLRVDPGSKLTPFARLQQARAYWRAGAAEDQARMEAILLDALGRFPDSEAAPLLRRFLLLERLESGRFEAALEVARDQIAPGPGGRFSPEALRFAGDQVKGESVDEFVEQARYLEGLILYALGRFDEAAAKLEAFIRDWPGSQEVSGAGYWLGQASLRLADAPRAAAAFGREAALRPNSYYGYKSLEAMAASGLPVSLAATAPDGPPVPPVCPNEAPSEGMAVNPDARIAIERAYALEEALLPELAEIEIAPVAQADPANPVLALEAARIATVNGRHQAASAFIFRAFSACLSRGGADQLAPIRDMLYPLKYADLVRAGLEGAGIEAQFVFSLIRQESFFDPAAVSGAGAVGLMQVLPETAKGLAAKLGEPAPPRERLFDPAVNIRYGTAYLARKYASLGSPVYLLCDYNAGPAKLNFWRANLGNLDPDLFVEFIPYTETRDYVRRILANMVMYKLLYK